MNHAPVAADFLPLERGVDAPEPLHADASQARRAWRRLVANRPALASLLVLLALLAAAIAGPWLWRVDPAAQQLGQASLAPSLTRRALLVADTEPPAACGDGGGLRVCGNAHTVAVRLAWDAVADAHAYRVYRHELAPRDAHDLGVPLAELGAGAAPAFEDRVGLEARRYVYSVAALDASGTMRVTGTLAIAVEQAIPWSAARRLGLVDASERARIGSQLRLPAHPLGTDYLGRDLLARALHGARTSLFVGFAAPLACTLLGLAWGGVAGYAGGRLDDALMRAADFVVALPFLLFMILLRVAFGIAPGESGVAPLLLAMVLLGWPAPARLVRAQVLALRSQPYVQAARLFGAGTPWLLARHMTPNVLGVLLVSLSFAIPSAIFTEAFLSFIGLGVVPPVPSWGSMCNDGIRAMFAHPHELVVPAVLISVTVLAFNVLGDGLHDALDERGDTR